MGTKTAHLTKFAFGKLQVRQRNCSLSTLEKLNSLRLDKKIVKFKKKKDSAAHFCPRGAWAWGLDHTTPDCFVSFSAFFLSRSF